jgi:glycosyltransferase involved in cell wall biosynthesis
VRNGLDGVLVPPADVDALAAAMSSLMADPSARACLATRAPEILDRFGLDTVMAMWDELLCSIQNRKLRFSL